MARLVDDAGEMIGHVPSLLFTVLGILANMPKLPVLVVNEAGQEGRMSRALHQSERRMKAKRLQNNGIHPSSSGMRPGSDDVHRKMGGSAAFFHLKRWRRSHGLRKSERRIKAKRLQYNGIHPSSFDEIDLRISSSCTFIRNESPPT
ncbi:unnamed protein product, partial [Protopolystoma xenopodis]